MVRISDARMSGTAYGTVVLAHRTRKRRTGGPLAHRPRTETRSNSTFPPANLVLHVPEEELAKGAEPRGVLRQSHTPIGATSSLYLDHVMQADTGADLDILTGGSGAEVPRESH